jgi:hypothetical protein
MLKTAGINFTFRLPGHDKFHAMAEVATKLKVSERIVIFTKTIKFYP